MATRRYRRRTLGNKISDVDKRLRYLEHKPARSSLKDFIVQTSKIQDRSVTVEKLSEELINDQDDVDIQLEALENEQGIIEDNISTVEGLAQSSANYKRATDPTTVKNISQLETNNGVVTYTTTTAHEFLPNNAVTIDFFASPLPPGFSDDFLRFNGTYAVKTVVSSTKFTIIKNTGLPNDTYSGGGTAAISPSYGDTWWDTNSDNEPKTWNGSSWDSVRDETISVAQGAAEDAQNAADAAQLSADGKSKVFRTTSAPVATAIGDIWFDIDGGVAAGEGDRPYRWNGSAWEEFGLSYLAVKSLDANTITTGTLTGRTIQTSSAGSRVRLNADTDSVEFLDSAGNLSSSIFPYTSAYGMLLLTEVDPGDPGSAYGQIEIFNDEINIFSGGSFYISAETVDIGGTTTLDIDTRIIGGVDTNQSRVRNIYIPSLANQSPTGGTNGSVWLEW